MDERETIVSPDAEPVPITVLVCDDDEDDRQHAREALEAGGVADDIRFVEDGEKLLDYLYRRGDFAGEAGRAPRPDLILLDLNMPRLDGRQTLAIVKGDVTLRDIPIVVLTASPESGEEIERCYQLGANSFLTKPYTHAGLAAAMKALGRSWLKVDEAPPPSE
jgi:CheY-like chemotaxis protein